MGKSVSDWIEKEMSADPELRGLLQEESLNADIAIKIYTARKEAGYTQKELADLVGTKQSNISRLEDADYDGHSLTMLKRIFGALDRELVINTPGSVATNLETPLACGGRLRDYLPVVTFAAERLRDTFPAELDVDMLLTPGCEGVLEADRCFENNKNFQEFLLPYAREAMLKAIQDRHVEGILKRRKSHLKLNFSEQYKSLVSSKTAIGYSACRSAVEDFDQFHTVNLEDGDGRREILLFTKQSKKKKTDLLDLVVVHQHDHELYAADSYRVDSRLGDDLFDLPPLEVLKRIIEKFGLEVTVGKKKGKFFLRETMAVASGRTSNLVGVKAPPRVPYHMYAAFRSRIDQGKMKVDVAMAYCIDDKKYRGWSSRRKVR